MKNYVLLVLLMCLAMSGCTERSALSCSDALERAHGCVQEFEASGDSVLLYRAMELLDSASQRKCRYPLFQPKLMLYMMLGEYDAGVAFVETYATNEFTYPYQRDVYAAGLRAMGLQQAGDSVGAVQVYRLLSHQIAAYYNEHRNKSVLFDLLSVQVNVLPTDSFVQLIEAIRGGESYGKYTEEEKGYLDMLLQKNSALTSPLEVE